ncbi:uncharacterized protein LOC129909839 [Episyrphus balteatus]|uniref:uncharacterized protein LOC129909839 n=1 Tax=Episyrphus balteatus TaxID=286459 RepID=UPI002485AE90|nr:uncharacterized protein LOC129909839 [Episyrphus balteatus]
MSGLMYLFCIIAGIVDLEPQECDIEMTRIVFFYGPSYTDRQYYDLDNTAAILNHPKFTMRRPTTAYMYGYYSSLQRPSAHLLVNAYLNNNSFNFLVIDWEQAGSGTYIQAQRNLLKLAPRVAESFVKLIDAGLNKDNFTLVGHSMGAHGVGLIGEAMSNQTKGRLLLPRVTGLDPSNPDYHKEFILPPVKKTSGQFVDIMHTSAGQRGTTIHSGHANFWPNNGSTIQPECPSEEVNILCSHLKALGYWAEGVDKGDTDKFLSFPAKSYPDFLETGGDKSKAVLMGIDCPTSAEGDYYLQVNKTFQRVKMLALRSKFVTCANIFLIFVLLFLNKTVLGDPINSVRIIFYHGPDFKDNKSYKLNDLASILKHPKFVHKNTSCYLHGYNNTQDDYSVHLLVDSYLKGNDFNFLTVDFAALVNGSYTSAQENILKLVPRLSNSFLDLIKAGLDVNSISLVGHSLGGVAVGLIGRDIYQKTNGRVILPRISPLDPSNPDERDDYFLPAVQKTDAKFVDVIHASAGQTGTPVHTGHVDFWPNGGEPIQPGCPEESVNEECSHHKAWAYWAQSVAKVNSRQLLSYRAKNYESYLANERGLKKGQAIPMGIYCPKSACDGDYYLKLNSTYGENGDPSGLPK